MCRVTRWLRTWQEEYIYQNGKKAIKGPRLQRGILYRSLGTSVHHHFFLPLELRLKQCAAWRWVDCAEKKGFLGDFKFKWLKDRSPMSRLDTFRNEKWELGTWWWRWSFCGKCIFVLVRKYLIFSETRDSWRDGNTLPEYRWFELGQWDILLLPADLNVASQGLVDHFGLERSFRPNAHQSSPNALHFLSFFLGGS